MKLRFVVLLITTSIVLSLNTHAQVDVNKTDTLCDNTLDKKKFIILNSAIVTVGTTSAIVLYHAWYKNYDLTSFHFINDNKEWLQMDKCGHLVSSYAINNALYNSYRWTGLDNKKSIIYSSIGSFLTMSTIEFFDGLSAEWGASWGDIAANVAGTAVFGFQQMIWQEQRIKFKISAHLTPYAQHRPDVLGSNFLLRLLKDYNGQTSWVSVNINSFCKNKSVLPDWLNVAFGYSAKGLIGGYENPPNLDIDPKMLDRKRQFVFSLDIDLEKINTSSKTLNTVLKLVNFIKVPMPAVIMDKDGVKFSAFYF
ncbi:MAG: DUF2279 domain-containing protein [Bacteroidales bacterium]|jgi:uncharacterized protein YfiM (DUF2279 family)